MIAALPRLRLVYAAVALGCLLPLTGHARAGDKQDNQQGKQEEPKLVLSVSPFGQFGLQLLDGGQSKKLTFNEEGGTNFTVVAVDGKNYLFGLERNSPEAKRIPPGLNPGKWVKKPAVLKPGISFQAVWSPVDKVEITHTMEIVRSKTGALDTCLVRYTVENKDTKAHKVGIRLLLDTFIVDNDGHPFAVPGKAELITTAADYKKDVPAVIQALQKPDLKAPGLVAYLSLKVGGGLESPDRVSLSHFPKGPQELVEWDMPVHNIGDDAIVLLYWNPSEVEAGARRLCGFAYGGGVVDLGKGRK